VCPRGYQPQGAVLVGQFMEAVEIGVQAQAQATQHQDSPLVHA